jgi:hypothetical protein
MSNAAGRRRHSPTCFRTFTPCILLLAIVLVGVPLHGQQTYVTRFDGYVGYAFLDSPHVNLFENGVAAQFGFRPKTWLSIGFDYNYARGNLSLTPNLLLPSLLPDLAPILAQAPSGYQLVVPAHSVTQTFAAGPELVYRHMTHVTLFFRPVYAGLIHEAATPQPVDPFQKAAVGGFEQLGLVPASGTKTDSVGFIGFGGGFDVLFGKHFGWRTQADLVYDHLFSDLLADGRFTVRFSTGPCFNFGKNIVK